VTSMANHRRPPYVHGGGCGSRVFTQAWVQCEGTSLEGFFGVPPCLLEPDLHEGAAPTSLNGPLFPDSCQMARKHGLTRFPGRPWWLIETVPVSKFAGSFLGINGFNFSEPQPGSGFSTLSFPLANPVLPRITPAPPARRFFLAGSQGFLHSGGGGRAHPSGRMHRDVRRRVQGRLTGLLVGNFPERQDCKSTGR